MKRGKRTKKILPVDEQKKLEIIIAESAGGVDIPDAGDIPGGFLNGGKDLLEGVYGAWREQVIEKQIKRWMEIHHKSTFP